MKKHSIVNVLLLSYCEAKLLQRFTYYLLTGYYLRLKKEGQTFTIRKSKITSKYGKHKNIINQIRDIPQ